MKCQDRIFVNTDISISVTFSGVATADIAELYVKFVNHENPSINKTYLLSTDGIDIDGDSISVKVNKADFETPGIYDIYMKRTDQAGNELGVVPCPASVNFYKML